MEKSIVSHELNLDTCELDLDIWETRRQALNSSIEDLQKHLQTLEGKVRFLIDSTETEVSRWMRNESDLVGTCDEPAWILRTQVNELQDFSNSHFNFFYTGFSPGGEFSLVPDRKDFPCEHVFRVVIDQIASDLVVVMDAVARYWRSEKMKKALCCANELAGSALVPVQEHLFAKTPEESEQTKKNKMPEVVTYFEKLASIRVTPYNDTLLISVPLTATSVPRDFLTTTHEVGHYVYWHAKIEYGVENGHNNLRPVFKALYYEVQEAVESLLEAIKKELSDAGVDDEVIRQVLASLRCLRRWREEIFADVYGCLIAGPVIALASQDLALQYSFQDFVSDDGDHPVPFLRPYVYIKTLEKMGHKKSAEILRERWKQRLCIRDQVFGPDCNKEGNDYLKTFEPAGGCLCIEDDDGPRDSEERKQEESPQEYTGIKRDHAIRVMDAIVEKVLELLEYPDMKGDRPEKEGLSREWWDWSKKGRWSRDLKDNELEERSPKKEDGQSECEENQEWLEGLAEQLYENFGEYLNEILCEKSYDLVTEQTDEEVSSTADVMQLVIGDKWRTWAKEEMGISIPAGTSTRGETSPQPQSVIIPAGDYEDAFRHPPNGTWKAVLLAAGWSTEIGNQHGG